MAVKSPLHDLHMQLGAKFTEFAGFNMPLQFSSIKDEHLTVRKNVGVFDVSHMSNIWISGKDAERLISLTTIEDASRFLEGMSQYTAILRDDGTVIDDTIFMHISGKYMIIPNAGMNKTVSEWLIKIADENNFDVKINDVSREYVIIAVQGPKSRETLQKITDFDLNKVKFFGCKKIDIAGVNCIISHTGYTGELGFELQVNPVNEAEKIFKKIIDAGKGFGIKPIGLGARDTLRLEKCFILAGNEFEGGRTPLEANLGWAINWDHEFIGKNMLLDQKEKGDYERLTYLVCQNKGIPRHGCKVQSNSKDVGVVSSGTLSPCLNKGIAMAYVKPDYREIGSTLDIIIRGKPVKAEIIKQPFVKKDWAQKN